MAPARSTLLGTPASPRILTLALLCCALPAWLSGPPGRLLVVLPLLLFGPGYLLDRALPALVPPTPFFRPALWLGLSLSMVALLYEWVTALGLALTSSALGVLLIGCGLGVIMCVWRGPAGSQARGMAGRGWSVAGGLWALALLAIFALTLWTRFVQIADLALPAWVDSVHHALMIRVAAERGQAPYSLRPYLPVDQLPYHWGYHVFVAVVFQLCGLPLGQTMLWTGQVLNALHVLAVAALAAYLWKRPLAGIVAGIVVGLISIMPAYYVSWGRYTQLTGLLLLPPLIVAWHAGLRAPSRRWLLCTATLLAGLSLIHFRVLIFALAFMGVIAVVWAIEQRPVQLDFAKALVQLGGANPIVLPPRHEGTKTPRSSFLCGLVAWWLGDEKPLANVRRCVLVPGTLYAVASAALALALAAPWLWSLLVRALLPALGHPQDLAGDPGYNGLNETLLWAGQNRLLIALALAAGLYGLLRRSRAAVEQIGWVGALAVLANPWLIGYILPAAGAPLLLWGVQRRRMLAVLCGAALLLLNPAFVRLPYLWLLTNDAVTISLFIPISLLIGGGAGMLTARLERGLSVAGQPAIGRTLLRYGCGVALGAIALWGAWNSRSVINPSTVLATGADVAAIQWAAEHTPPDARFLIDAVPWLPGVDRAADGGWWLLPLAGRWVSTPPALYIYGSPDDIAEARAISAQVAGFHSGDEQRLYQLIQRAHITYIYLGAHPGPLSQASFAGNKAFEKVYEHDGVTILAVHRQS